MTWFSYVLSGSVPAASMVWTRTPRDSCWNENGNGVELSDGRTTPLRWYSIRRLSRGKWHKRAQRHMAAKADSRLLSHSKTRVPDNACKLWYGIVIRCHIDVDNIISAHLFYGSKRETSSSCCSLTPNRTKDGFCGNLIRHKYFRIEETLSHIIGTKDSFQYFERICTDFLFTFTYCLKEKCSALYDYDLLHL